MNIPSFIPLMRAQTVHAGIKVTDDCTSAADAMQRVARVRNAFRQAHQVKKAAPIVRTQPAGPLRPQSQQSQGHVRDWLIIDATALTRESANPYAWRRLLEEVASLHGLDVRDIISNRRSHHVVMARHEAFWRLHNELSLSYLEIGRRCGGREHSAVRNGVLQHEKRLGIPHGTVLLGRRTAMSEEERADIAALIRAGRSNYSIRQILKIGIIKVRRVRAELDDERIREELRERGE